MLKECLYKLKLFRKVSINKSQMLDPKFKIGSEPPNPARVRVAGELLPTKGAHYWN